ncbi:MAG: prepilin-type N-terminal cleavage/methylation domain-containing protein [Desulfomonilaceae bacterium]
MDRKNVTDQQESGLLDIRLYRQGCRSYYGSATRDADLRLSVERLRKDSRGFTIVEMMVALFIVALIFSIVIGFYLFQSKRGGQSAKETSARHSVALALMQIQRDVVQMGYGVAQYPQMAYYFDTENTLYPSASKPYYDTLYVNYGQFLKSTIPTTGDIGNLQNQINPFPMWPALVYNLYIANPMTSANIQSGYFSIPAPTQAEANANIYNVGGIIYLTNPTTPTTARPGAERVTPPGKAVPTPTGQTMASPPSGWVTQFALSSGSAVGCSGAALAGNYYFTPAVVYSFLPPQTDATGKITVPGQILRNGLTAASGQCFLGGGQGTSTTGQDTFFSVQDFQVKGLFVQTNVASTSIPQQKWAPKDGDFCTLTNPQQAIQYALRYVEITIVYTINYSNLPNQQIQANAITTKTATRIIRVNPRTVVLAQYPGD